MPRQNPIKVMVVDDSFFMRKAIERIFQSTDDIFVCESAASGEAALERLEVACPDLITMDVEMPGMGGIAAVRAIIAKRRVPILMLSSLTERGAQTTVRALSSGASDFVTKPTGGLAAISEIAAELIGKVRMLGKPASIAYTPGRLRPGSQPSSGPRFTGKLPAMTDCIAIAISTGGPAALTAIFSQLPATVNIPIVVVQHMPRGFTKPLAERLNMHSDLTIVEAEDGARLRAGTVLIGAAGKSLRLERGAFGIIARIEDPPDDTLYSPSADTLFASLAEVYGDRATAMIMTGMGADGIEGLAAIKEAGGFVFGQSEASCTVYGMPRAAAEAGLVDQVIALDEVAGVIAKLCKAKESRS
jgi:two-component system chemotaxis response regulator CheB